MTKFVQVSEKKAYSTPKLVVYGDLATITAGVTGTKADPGHTTPTKRGGT